MFDVAPSTFADTMPRMSCLAVRTEGSRENYYVWWVMVRVTG